MQALTCYSSNFKLIEEKKTEIFYFFSLYALRKTKSFVNLGKYL